eukprot:NODE_6471_length_1669_cov_3.269131.p1 GENE.NODE_6471_length_1669_cov_3.269131~~NODE_6471_length_1669_cov_3.269131.p1  ORF type:complete len:529 (-),score=147.08 NODE_6471_length_1669_cov_3.269131:81-1499(-)
MTDFGPSTDEVMGVGTAMIVAFAVSMGLSLIYCLFRNLRPGRKYDYFICHHKAGAQAQARLVKQLLQSHAGRSVFIDSDDLCRLDGLFSIVGFQVNHLLVYLTDSTLRRPWCVGEIVTALRSGVRVTLIKTPSFAPPTPSQIANLSSYIDFSSTALSEYGISLDDIAAAFKKVLDPDFPSYSLGLEHGIEKFNRLAGTILSGVRDIVMCEKKPNLIGAVFLPLGSSIQPCRIGEVVLSVDGEDDEAIAAAGILTRLIGQEVVGLTGERIISSIDQTGRSSDEVCSCVVHSRAVIVLLSRHTLSSFPQLLAIAEAVAQSEHCCAACPMEVIPIHLPDFEFPSEHYYEGEFAELWRGWPGNARVRMESLFNRISVHLATSASEGVLHSQAKQVLGRIPKAFQNELGLERRRLVMRGSVVLKRTKGDIPANWHGGGLGGGEGEGVDGEGKKKKKKKKKKKIHSLKNIKRCQKKKK